MSRSRHPAEAVSTADTRRSVTRDDRERALGVAKLVAQLETMIQESGDSRGFDAAAWVARWVNEPVPALGARPFDILTTKEGQALVSTLLAQIQSGSYA